MTFNDILRIKYELPKLELTKLERAIADAFVPKDEPFRDVAVECVAHYGINHYRLHK